jgi:hypothetical protein
MLLRYINHHSYMVSSNSHNNSGLERVNMTKYYYLSPLSCEMTIKEKIDSPSSQSHERLAGPRALGRLKPYLKCLCTISSALA